MKRACDPVIGIARTESVANSHPTLSRFTMTLSRQQILGSVTSLWWLFVCCGRVQGRFCRVVTSELDWVVPCGPTAANTPLYNLYSLLPPLTRDQHLVSSLSPGFSDAHNSLLLISGEGHDHGRLAMTRSALTRFR